MATIQDLEISLEDARFFCDQMEPMIRGPEQLRDLDVIRRFFRAYLHCWKCILHFVREEKGLKQRRDWVTWCETWQQRLRPEDRAAFELLRKSRDRDTHKSIINVDGEIAAGLFPIVMFEPDEQSEIRTELISCCKRGLCIAELFIRDYATV